MFERKYAKLMGRIAKARVLHDWSALLAAKYELYDVKRELGVK